MRWWRRSSTWRSEREGAPRAVHIHPNTYRWPTGRAGTLSFLSGPPCLMGRACVVLLPGLRPKARPMGRRAGPKARRAAVPISPPWPGGRREEPAWRRRRLWGVVVSRPGGAGDRPHGGGGPAVLRTWRRQRMSRRLAAARSSRSRRARKGAGEGAGGDAGRATREMARRRWRSRAGASWPETGRGSSVAVARGRVHVGRSRELTVGVRCQRGVSLRRRGKWEACGQRRGDGSEGLKGRKLGFGVTGKQAG